MDNVMLGAVNDAINQLSFRIDDLNNRINEVNKNIRDLEKHVDQVYILVSNIDKRASLNRQTIDNHIKSHDSESKRREVTGINIISLIGNFSSALMGAGLMLYLS